jgi:hypothetical protein
MTGPCSSTVHPLPRRPWLLLPLLATVAFFAQACSDQPTEPGSSTFSNPAAAKVSHPVRKPAASRMAAGQATAPKPMLSFAVAQSSSGNGPSVLIVADTDVVSTNALAASLADSGVQVTVRPAPEYTWDGTNPSLTGFDVVLHLNGATYDLPLESSAQTALTSFVSNGGGFVGAKWNGYEPQPELSELVLLGHGGFPDGPEQNCAACQVTYEQLPAGAGHPVLAGLPSSFSFTADGHDAGPAASFATVLMQVPSGGPAVLVREYGTGRVVNFSFAPNYQWDDIGNVHDPVTLQDPKVQKLYLNAVRWAAGMASGTAQPQTITFGPIADRVYGDPAFDLDATASSGLPVNYSSTGPCSVLGSSVTLTGAGSCTITAHQAGNGSYEPAPDVSRSFAIAKAPASMTVGTEYTYDGTTKAAEVTTSPAGLSGVTVVYTLAGSPVISPINAGTYQVTATLDNPNYQAPDAHGFLIIHPATPTIRWEPGYISVATPLGPTHLNAIALGIGGVEVTGSYVYSPAAGTRLRGGKQQLSVEFTSNDPNYTGASQTIFVQVNLGFRWVHPPAKRVVNVVRAGSTIPLKFSVLGAGGRNAVEGEPASFQVSCSARPANSQTKLANLDIGGWQPHTYLWKTSRSWAGTCRKIVISLFDDSRHEAVFYFARQHDDDDDD